MLPRLQGAFSTVVDDEGPRLRLPRPGRACGRSCIGRLGERYCVSSESCALDIIGAEYVRDVQPGEMVVIGEDGLTSRVIVEGEREAFCVFEHIYFARPDSKMGGTVLQAARGRMGEILARESPAPSADLVIAVPDSRQPGGPRLRPRERPSAGRRLRQEPLRRAHLHPARPGAAQARPADEVQPAARRSSAAGAWSSSTTRSCAATRRARSSRCCATRARSRCTCASARRRSATRASTGSTCTPARRWSPTAGRSRRSPSTSAPTRSPTCRWRASTRRSAATARGHCDACFSGDYPLKGTEEAQGKFALENTLPLASSSA